MPVPTVLSPSAKLRDDTISHLPPWAQTLAKRYYTKTLSTFICHGSVRDLQPGWAKDGSRRFIPLKAFLSEELFGARDFVLFYDRSSGLRGGTPDMQRALLQVVEGYDANARRLLRLDR